MKKSFIILIMLTGFCTAEAEKKAQCNCAEKSPTRLSVIKGEKQIVHYAVSGMTNGGDAQRLRETLSTVPELKVLEVNHEKGTVHLSYKGGAKKVEDIMNLMEKSGFQVTGEHITAAVNGMKCGGCEKSLTKILTLTDGVQSVEAVSHKTGEIQFTITPEACRATIEKQITNAGFTFKGA